MVDLLLDAAFSEMKHCLHNPDWQVTRRAAMCMLSTHQIKGVCKGLTRGHGDI